jgi:glycosyltransferase involved in cell wall biosynthesis
MVRISIVIATYNRGEKLLRTLRSLVAQTLPSEEWEAVAVNNNSSDNTAEVFAGFAAAHPGLNLRMVDEGRQGLSWARNRGIAEARAAVIAIIDDDEEVNEGFCEAYATLFDRHPEISAAGGKVIPLYETGRPVWMSCFTERPIAGTLDRGNAEKPFERGYPAGGNMAVRAEIFAKYGAFNTALGRTGDNPMGGEEKDFFARLSGAGETVWYVPEAVIHHIIPPEKLTMKYFRRLARGCGASERVRTLSMSRGKYMLAVVSESLKWVATLALALWYTLLQKPLKAHYLIEMRRSITSGLMSKKMLSGEK